MTIEYFKGQYRFLSNFAPSPIQLEGFDFPTAEHAFQALKTLDPDARRQVANAPAPDVAKFYGRKVPLRADWEDVKYSVMEQVVGEKFRQNPDLALKLADTGDVQLIEGNYWHDQIWGDCHCSRHVGDDGQNALGAILMKVRQELRAQ